jgi:hypothetical protein
MKRSVSVVIVGALVALLFYSCNNSEKMKVDTNAADSNTSTVSKVALKDTMYTCKMHKDVISDKPGECPICGMSLVRQKITGEQIRMIKEGKFTKPKE